PMPYATAVVYWRSGSSAGELVRPYGDTALGPVVPPSLAECGSHSAFNPGYEDLYPLGLNNSGRVLLRAVDLDATPPQCSALFIWRGHDDPFKFMQVPLAESPQLNDISNPCAPGTSPAENFANSDNHINDADHISLTISERPPLGEAGSPYCSLAY